MGGDLNPLQKFFLAISLVGGLALLGIPLLVGIGWLANFLGFIGTQPASVQDAIPHNVPWFVPLLFLVAPIIGIWWLLRGAGDAVDLLTPLKLGHESSESTIRYSDRGAVLGYKWLRLEPRGKIRSPLYDDEWKGYKLHSDKTPKMGNTAGIYFTTSPNDKALKGYEQKGFVLCEIEFYDNVVFHDAISRNNGDGGRAESGEIVRIIKKGKRNRFG